MSQPGSSLSNQMSLADDRQTVAKALHGLVNGTRREVKVILLLNAMIGLGWLLGAEARTMGSINDPAKFLFSWQESIYPMRIYGLILLGLCGIAVVAFWGLHVSVFQWTMYVITTYWAFWAVIYTVGVVLGSASGIGAVLAVGFARRNFVLAGVSPWMISKR
jgi:hypothetical protein